MEIRAVKTIKIDSISKDAFDILVDDYDHVVIGLNAKFMTKHKITGDAEHAFMKGMIDVLIKHFPRNGILKVEMN